MTKSVSMIIIAATCTVSTACDQPHAEADADEALARTQLALCSWPDSPVPKADETHAVPASGSVVVVADDPAYIDGGPCDSYIVSFTNATRVRVGPAVRIGTPTECEASRLEVKLWRRTSNTSWSVVSSFSEVGSWSDSSCDLRLTYPLFGIAEYEYRAQANLYFDDNGDEENQPIGFSAENY